MMIITNETKGRSDTWHACHIEVRSWDERWVQTNEVLSVKPGTFWKDQIQEVAKDKRLKPNRVRLVDHLS